MYYYRNVTKIKKTEECESVLDQIKQNPPPKY